MQVEFTSLEAGMIKFNLTKNNVKTFVNKLYDLDFTKLWTVTIHPKKYNRSLSQNDYYWKLLRSASDYFGYTEEELHALFKTMYLQETKMVLNREVTDQRSTSSLNTEEFNEYIKKIKVFCCDFGFQFEEE